MKTKILLPLIFCACIISVHAQWTNLNTGTAEDLNSIHFNNDSLGFIVGNNGIVLKTTNYGNSWSSVFAVNTENFYSVFSLNEDTIYIGSDNLYITNDSGINWTVSNTSSTTVITDIYYKNSTLGFLNVPWNLYKYGSQGTWEQVVYKSLNDLQFTSSNIAYIDGIDFPGSGTCHGFYKSLDGGNNWSFIQPTDCFQILTYDFLNDQIGYLVTSNMGLYKTIDGSNTWSLINNNISNDTITDCIFINEDCGYLTCENGNIYKTTDEGYTWNIDYSSSDTLVSIFTTDNYLYVIGSNGTALRNQIYLGVSHLDSQNNSIKIFPNPVRNSIKIAFSNLIIDHAIISVIDLNGSKIFEKEYQNFGDQIEIVEFELEDGVYFIQINTDETVSVKKIIVN